MPLPLLAAISLGQAALGAAQAFGSGRNAREKELDAYAKQSPLYKGSKPISEYYQQALNRANENAYQSQQYQMGAKEARRATAQGLNALQGRRVLGDISTLAEREKSNLEQLGIQAESQRNQRFGQLGAATQMKNADLMQQFDINQMTPYNRMLQLKQLKAQAANDRYNAGMQMIGSAASNAALGAMYGGFDKKPKVVTPSALSESTNILGSPFQKYGSTDFSRFGVNKAGFTSKLNKNYLLPTGGLPARNNNSFIDEYLATEFN
jgi:hypothetical protein